MADYVEGALIGLLLAAPLTLPGQGSPPAPETRFSADVNLVLLSLTVQDRNGNPVPGLQRSDFHVFEDGKLQDIREFHHTIYEISHAEGGDFIAIGGRSCFFGRAELTSGGAREAGFCRKSTENIHIGGCIVGEL